MQHSSKSDSESYRIFPDGKIQDQSVSTYILDSLSALTLATSIQPWLMTLAPTNETIRREIIWKKDPKGKKIATMIWEYHGVIGHAIWQDIFSDYC